MFEKNEFSESPSTRTIIYWRLSGMLFQLKLILGFLFVESKKIFELLFIHFILNLIIMGTVKSFQSDKFNKVWDPLKASSKSFVRERLQLKTEIHFCTLKWIRIRKKVVFGATQCTSYLKSKTYKSVFSPLLLSYSEHTPFKSWITIIIAKNGNKSIRMLVFSINSIKANFLYS